jgi:integrase
VSPISSWRFWKAPTASCSAAVGLLATLAGARVRVGEALALTWENVNTDRGELVVLASKTEAGRRTVDLTPALRDELAAWHRRTRYPARSDFVFPNGKGRQDNRNNVRRRLLEPAVANANVKLATAGIEPITNLTTHGLRRTYGSLRHAVGDEAVYTATQIGHADASFTLRVYTVAAKRRERMSEGERAEAERAYAWAGWTALGTSAQNSGPPHRRRREGRERRSRIGKGVPFSRDGRIRTGGLLLPKQTRRFPA